MPSRSHDTKARFTAGRRLGFGSLSAPDSEASVVTDLLLLVHPWLGYAVAALVLVASLTAFKRAKDGLEFRAGLYRAAFLLLSLQVLLGIVLYGLGGYWDATALNAYIHPILGVLALGVGQVLLGRARKTRMAADAHRLAGRGLLLSLLLIVLAIGVASIASVTA